MHVCATVNIAIFPIGWKLWRVCLCFTLILAQEQLIIIYVFCVGLLPFGVPRSNETTDDVWKGKGWKRYLILAYIYCMSTVYVKFRKISYKVHYDKVANEIVLLKSYALIVKRNFPVECSAPRCDLLSVNFGSCLVTSIFEPWIFILRKSLVTSQFLSMP